VVGFPRSPGEALLFCVPYRVIALAASDCPWIAEARPTGQNPGGLLLFRPCWVLLFFPGIEWGPRSPRALLNMPAALVALSADGSLRRRVSAASVFGYQLTKAGALVISNAGFL